MAYRFHKGSELGFDYDFGAVEGTENPLTKSYEDLAYEPLMSCTFECAG